jgi:hypothetical protein
MPIIAKNNKNDIEWEEMKWRLDCLPVGMDNQVGTSTCKSLQNIFSALQKKYSDCTEHEGHRCLSLLETYLPASMVVKPKNYLKHYYMSS